MGDWDNYTTLPNDRSPGAENVSAADYNVVKNALQEIAGVSAPSSPDDNLQGVIDRIDADLIIGRVLLVPFSTVPSGFLECDGSSLLKATYSDLYSALCDGGGSCIYGEADADHFYLPDYRGRFLRGWDHGAGNDPDAATRTDRGDTTTGDNVGTKQASMYASHRHEDFYIRPSINNSGGVGPYFTTSATTSQSNKWMDYFTGYAGGNETRPLNINMMTIIKY